MGYKEMGEGSEPIDPKTFKIIDTICNRMKNKYSFAYYKPEDIYNESFILAMDGLTRYTGQAPLENFLSVHISNRLKNLVRKYYSQPKQNLVNALGFQNVDDSGESSMRYEDSHKHIYSKDLEDYIDDNLQPKFRADYLKLLDNEYIVPLKRKLLKEELKRLMDEFYAKEKRPTVTRR